MEGKFPRIVFSFFLSVVRISNDKLCVKSCSRLQESNSYSLKALRESLRLWEENRFLSDFLHFFALEHSRLFCRRCFPSRYPARRSRRLTLKRQQHICHVFVFLCSWGSGWRCQHTHSFIVRRILNKFGAREFFFTPAFSVPVQSPRAILFVKCLVSGFFLLAPPSWNGSLPLL